MSSSSGINGVLLCSSLFLVYLCWVLLRVVQKLWLGPIRVQSKMAAQGIKGPPYRFLHGSTKEMFQMRKDAMESSISMGLSHDILPKVQPHVYNWINRYGKTYLNWIGPQAELVVAEPVMIKEILNNKDKTFTKTETRGFLKQLLGDGLVTSEGAKWAKLRKLANHAFHGESLKSSFPGVVDSVHMMLERWKQNEGREIEVFEEMRLFTSEVISRAAFGSSYIEGRNIFEMLRRLVLFTSRNDSKIRFLGLSKIWKTDDEIEGEKLERGIRSSILEMIKKREEKAAAREVNGFGDDLLGLLVKALHDEDETKRITLDDLVDECKTFYFAGQETTNSMLTWTIFLLSVHTDWQEAARKEVISTLGHQVPDYDGIAKLKTMTMIIHESLRLYPPVISITRKLDRKAKLGELVLPAKHEHFCFQPCCPS